MGALVARTGRALQRYAEGRRLVVGCIPYRLIDDKSCNVPIDEAMEVLVISSQKGQGTMFPKGGWETDETKEAAAIREAMEEAGVRGIVQASLGEWRFKSKRYGTDYDGFVFALLVQEQLDQWPEESVRKRRWVSVAEARENCQHWWMREALDKLVDHLSNSIRNTSS